MKIRRLVPRIGLLLVISLFWCIRTAGAQIPAKPASNRRICHHREPAKFFRLARTLGAICSRQRPWLHYALFCRRNNGPGITRSNSFRGTAWQWYRIGNITILYYRRLGLETIKNRAAQLHGALEIFTHPEGGTAVVLSAKQGVRIKQFTFP